MHKLTRQRKKNGVISRLGKHNEPNKQEIPSALSQGFQYSRKVLLEKGKKQLAEVQPNGNGEISFAFYPSAPAFLLSTLAEFENGVLLVNGFEEPYRPLVLDLSRAFQDEYKCNTKSEKALAHLAAQNYVRTLLLQKELHVISSADTYNEIKLKRYQIMSKAYDQANRQFLSALQMLKALHQPQMNFTVNARVAHVAQQQVIQENYAA